MSTRLRCRADVASHHFCIVCIAGPGLRLNEHLRHDDGRVVFRYACKLGLEGIVSKRKDSPYRSAGSGPLGNWAAPQMGVGRSSGSGVGSAPSDHVASGVGLLSSTTLSLGLGRGFFLSATRRRVTMTDQARRHLAQADRHIAECKALIARQEELVRRITQRGQPTNWAEDTRSEERRVGKARRTERTEAA